MFFDNVVRGLDDVCSAVDDYLRRRGRLDTVLARVAVKRQRARAVQCQLRLLAVNLYRRPLESLRSIFGRRILEVGQNDISLEDPNKVVLGDLAYRASGGEELWAKHRVLRCREGRSAYGSSAERRTET